VAAGSLRASERKAVEVRAGPLTLRQIVVILDNRSDRLLVTDAKTTTTFGLWSFFVNGPDLVHPSAMRSTARTHHTPLRGGELHGTGKEG
jgi:hypothetical protein